MMQSVEVDVMCSERGMVGVVLVQRVQQWVVLVIGPVHVVVMVWESVEKTQFNNLIQYGTIFAP